MAHFKLQLYISERMTEAGETGIARMPLKAREFTSGALVDDGILKIVCGKKQKEMEIKQVFLEDLRKLNRQVKEGDLNQDDVNVCCFLSQDDYDSITYKRDKHDPWVTNEIDPIMIGTDPEFVLMEEGEVVRASNLLPFDDKFGSDGNWAELRPDPSQDISEVVDNISVLLRKGNKVVEELDWMAGACYHVDQNRVPYIGEWCPIGGHIHLGNPNVQGKVNHDTFRALADILDDLVVIPLIRVDGPHADKRRQHKGYGVGCGGDRWQFSGSKGRLEWRTPSGIWLCHPLVTEAILGTTKAVAESFYQRWGKKKYNFDFITTSEDKTILTGKTIYSDGYKEIRDKMCSSGIRKSFGIKTFTERTGLLTASKTSDVSNECKILNRRLRGLDKYSDYKSQIDTFTALVNASREDIKSLDMNLKNNWRGQKRIFLE